MMVPALGRRGVLVGMTMLAGPAFGTKREVVEAIQEVTKGAVLQPGRVVLDLAQMVENGNAVGVVVRAEPPEGGRVVGLHVFAEGNPLPRVMSATFGPASAEPRLATRMRLATSQTVVAVAVMEDGSCWSDSVTVMVTLAACLE